MAYGRPWYIQATDVAHRVFVIGIIGFSGWLTVGLARTVWANRDSAVQARLAQAQALADAAEQQQLLEQQQQQQAPPHVGQHANAAPSKVEASIAKEALAALADQERK